jgi:hypothetical protein
MKFIFLLSLVVISFYLRAQNITTRFEESNGKQTPDYHEIINWWKMLDGKSSRVKMLVMGPTDSGYPLHLVIVANENEFELVNLRKKNKRIILINNGIHPGEPDGIDASMLLVRDIVINKARLPDNIVLAIIPVYNIGGCLNRSAYYRVNQNGPEEFGFRGNSQNLDLNRDFIKCDSKEAKSFTEIFHSCDPDVFIDNHVSNGADYQHIMTLISSQHNKLGGTMGEFMNNEFEPGIYKLMKQKGYDLIPYVNVFNASPENGWTEFLETPRYSSGYATLWHSFAFVPETHMLKPYDQRVQATYELMQSFIEFTSKNSGIIKAIRDKTKESSKHQHSFPISWTIDSTKLSEINFKGYQAIYKPSEISGLPRLYYDRTQPFEKKVKFYDTYNANIIVTKPHAYLVPQGWWKVIELLKLNKVQMHLLKSDTMIEVEVYRITDYKTSQQPVEMHHINSNVKLVRSVQKMNFLKGDFYIPMNQTANRFLVEVLEPLAHDSYFTWNFFDGILTQKEGFSDYVFEQTAVEVLKNYPEIRKAFEQQKLIDTSFSKSTTAQLNFIYQRSPYYEPAHLRYPVYRVTK